MQYVRLPNVWDPTSFSLKTTPDLILIQRVAAFFFSPTCLKHKDLDPIQTCLIFIETIRGLFVLAKDMNRTTKIPYKKLVFDLFSDEQLGKPITDSFNRASVADFLCVYLCIFLSLDLILWRREKCVWQTFAFSSPLKQFADLFS